MDSSWKEVIRLTFKGDRFRDHALDLSALSELSQFQKIVAETAKALWRAANPDRERLPKHFEQRARLCLRRIEDGSAIAPLEIEINGSEQDEFWEPEPKEVEDAINLAYEVFDAVERKHQLPERFPKSLVNEYVKWGQSLADDEEVQLAPLNKRATSITSNTRKRLATFAEAPYEDVTDVTGEVKAADVHQQRFQLWLDDQKTVIVSFTPEQEEKVTTALRDHKTVRMRVQGRGRYTPEGQLQRVETVDSLEFSAATPQVYDNSAPSIEQELMSLALQISPDDWRQLPDDLTDDLDHYLYGTPKR